MRENFHKEQQNGTTDNSNGLKEIAQFLFGFRYTGEIGTPEPGEDRKNTAAKEIETHPWKDVFDSWYRFLREDCPTPDDVWGWERLFWIYGGQDFPLRNPYPFLGYLLYRTALPGRPIEDPTDQGLFDSIAMEFLTRIGDVTLDTMDDFGADTDPRIIAQADVWRNRLGPAHGIERE